MLLSRVCAFLSSSSSPGVSVYLVYSFSVSCFNSLVPGPVLVEFEYPVVAYNLTTYSAESSGKTDTKLGSKLVSKIIWEVIRTVKGVNWKLMGRGAGCGGQLSRPQVMMPAFLPSTFVKISGWPSGRGPWGHRRAHQSCFLSSWSCQYKAEDSNSLV